MRSNDFESLLQEHNADPEREPPGEGSRTPSAYPASSKFLLECAPSGWSGPASSREGVPIPLQRETAAGSYEAR